MTPFAKLLDAIPEVPTTAYRNAFYASPTINTRVHNLATGNIEMWDGSAWQTIFEGVTSGAGRVIFTGVTAPNGTQVGSAGDAYVQQVSATVTLLWLKQSGTGTNTGWQALSATGTGSPEGVIASPIGVTYAQTDGATGNVTWVKNSGTGATGWRLLSTSYGTFNVQDYGAKGDGTTDDTTAIQAAVTAAGSGGHVYFPPGNYKLTGTLTGLAFQLWEGPTFELGTGSPATTQLSWPAITGSTIGVLAGASTTFHNLLFRGPGKTGNTCIGIVGSPNDGVTPNSPRLDACQVFSWNVGVKLNPAYYAQFRFCEMNYNGIAIECNNSYNVDVIHCRFGCYDSVAASGGYAIYGDAAIRNLKVTGGSIEGFGSGGGISLYSGSQCTVLGTYWESSIAGTNAFGIDCRTSSNVTIAVFGNLVYLTEMNRWINGSGLTAITITGSGNKFVCPNTSSTTPVAYYGPSTGDVTLHGDDWSDVQKGTYISTLASLGPQANWNVTPPLGVTGLDPYTYLGRTLWSLLPAKFQRLIGTGTAHVAGDYALSAGWGTTASVSAVSARDTGGRVTIASAGTGQGANPTVTLTWKDGTWTTAPAVTVSRGDLAAPSGNFQNTTLGATTIVFTFNGTPVAGNSYILDFVAIGK